MIQKLKQNRELWDLYTRKEEYDPIILDQFDRFTYCLSKHRNIFEPEVSRFLIENGMKIEYPEDKKFALCLTHDIDVLNIPKSTTISNSISSLIYGQIKNTFEMPFLLVNKKRSPLWNFKNIIELEKKYNAKSSFYILTVDEDDTYFEFDVNILKEEFGYILDNGCEVGLHGGLKAFGSTDELNDKKQKLEKILGKKVIGYRNHFLAFKVPNTWEYLSKAGFEYDVTFGYNDCVGFRNGMCHPYKPFNLNTDKEINILEIPLIIMDNTLFDYMRFNYETAWDTIKMIIDTVEKHNGILTILWHNTYMIDWKIELYEEILRYCKKKDAWMTSGENISDWWNKHVRY